MGKTRIELKPFHVGDKVRIPFGDGRVDAVILEDRGPLSADGTHIFVVQVPMPPSEPMTFEVPEDWMESTAVKSR